MQENTYHNELKSIADLSKKIDSIDHCEKQFQVKRISRKLDIYHYLDR